MKSKAFLKGSVFLLLTLFLLLGCAGKGKGVKTIQEDPETLYKQGLAKFNKRDYVEAQKKFEQLKSGFPDSPPYTIWAELKIADCHFLKKEYVEAIAAYEEFKKIHPTHEEIPYVQYQIGLAYFNQILTLDRDQTSTKKALSNFEYLIANYPPSLFVEKAKGKIDVCRKRLVDHEFYIGNFYYKHGKYQAAVFRFEELLKKFPKGTEGDKTLYLLGKSYLKIDQGEKAIEVFAKIVNEYPKSPHYREAKAIIDQGVKEKKTSLRKAKEFKEEVEITEGEPDRVVLVKFEEEERRPVSLKEEKKVELEQAEERVTPLPVTSEPVKPIPPPPAPPTPKTEPRIEGRPEEEKRIAALPGMPTLTEEKEKPKKIVPPEPGEAKLGDKGQPIDITSDRVETYSKENLVVFKGNVMARQKDIVIYADSLEAVIIADGKGIEKVVAGGNVKIQQGLRVASCQKAVFYNIDQKVVLTGDPKVWEGDNMVSGDEIVFDIEQNRVEVKGGPGGRGKAKIHPGGEFEKPK